MRINKVSNPTFVTESQTVSFLNKKGFEKVGTYYVCKDSASLFKVLGRAKGIPETNFFSSSGEFIAYGDSSCPGLAMNFAKTFTPDGHYKTDPSFKLEEIMSLVKPVGGISVDKNFKADFSVVFYWATFVGKINNNVFEIADELKKNSLIKIRFLFVNVDFQKSWGMKNIPIVVSNK
ncbi:MAG: hypothetical protein NTU98_14835 [Bacteroidetes bacterium]|nr:hypothetical protein [Bacteroidota bacterium]